MERSDDWDIGCALDGMRRVCSYIRRCFQVITVIVAIGLIAVVAAVLFRGGVPHYGDMTAALYMAVGGGLPLQYFGTCLSFLIMWLTEPLLFLKIRLIDWGQLP